MNTLKLVLLVVATLAGLSQAIVVEECQTSYYGPLKRIKPIRHDVTMNICDKSFKYTAESAIKIRIEDSVETKSEPTNVIVLHADDNLEIEGVTFFGLYKEEAVKSVCRNSENQLLVVTVDEELKHDSEVSLYVHVATTIRDDGKSLLREDSNGGKTIVRANFRHTSARSAFACFDDPSLKTIFEVHIMHDHHLEVASSTLTVWKRNVLTHHKDRKLSIFHPTAPIAASEIEFELLLE